MTRPDEIAALADELNAKLPVFHGNERNLIIRTIAALRLSATSPGDALREALEPFALILKGNLFHQPDDLKLNFGPNEHDLRFCCTVGDLRRACNVYRGAALAPAEKAGDATFDKLFNYRSVFGATLREMILDYHEGNVSDGRAAKLTEEYIRSIYAKFAATPTPPSGDVARQAYVALFEPAERDAIDNLEGALIDIKRLSDAGKPTDAVCIRTIERVQQQLIKAHEALIQSAAPGGGTKSDGGVERRHAVFDGEATRLTRDAKAVREAGVAPGPSDPAQEPEAVCVGIDRSGEDVTALSLRRGTDVFTFIGLQAEFIIAAIEQASRPVSLDREAIARIIDPKAFDQEAHIREDWKPEWVASRQYAAFKSADAILALIEGRT